MDDDLKKWTKVMESNSGLAAASSDPGAPSSDWSESADDLGSEDWEERLGGPDDSYWESSEHDAAGEQYTPESPEDRELAELDYPDPLRAELYRLRNRTIIGTYDTFAQAVAVARRSTKFVVTRSDDSAGFVVFVRKR